ncbi:hypothetical protein, partial [Klebsiella pneumoniae]|uniref:hypothetical protein n=1 Tax=Klebsiella pneumoniae TaxID=573 RepID=UPI00272FB6F8
GLRGLFDGKETNGLIDKKDDALYTGTQLNDLGTRFNQQLSELNSASQALDQDIPTRKEIALLTVTYSVNHQEKVHVSVSRYLGSRGHTVP